MTFKRHYWRKNIKKLISILIAVAVIFSAMICVSASASRSMDFLEKFERDKMISLKLSDYERLYAGFVPVSDIDYIGKFTKNENGEYEFEYVSHLKYGLTKVKIFGDSNKINAYFHIFKVNLLDIAKKYESDISIPDDFLGEYYTLLTIVDSGAAKYLKVVKETVDYSRAYDDVTVEYLGPDYEEIVKDLPAETQEELEGKTDEEIAEALAEFAESDDPELRFFAGLTNADAKFYYRGDDLVRYIFEFPDKKTGAMLFARDWPSDPVIISADIDDDAFDEPKFSIDITHTVKPSIFIISVIFDIVSFFESILNIPGTFLG